MTRSSQLQKLSCAMNLNAVKEKSKKSGAEWQSFTSESMKLLNYWTVATFHKPIICSLCWASHLVLWFKKRLEEWFTESPEILSTVAEKGHSIMPISVFPILTIPILAFPISAFPIWTFPIWTFQIRTSFFVHAQCHLHLTTFNHSGALRTDYFP